MPPHRHGAIGEIGTAILDPQADLAVVDQQIAAGNQGREDFGMGHLHPVGIAQRRIQVEPEPVAFLKIASACGELAHPQFRSLKIGQDGDRTARLCLDRADDVMAGAVVGVAAMAHVQAKHVGAGVEQRADHVLGAGSRSQRRHDLHIAMSSHSAALFPFALTMVQFAIGCNWRPVSPWHRHPAT